MELDTKAQIARATLSILILVVSLFFLGVLLLVLCAALEINPFREIMRSFLIAAFIGLIGVAAVLFLLNVATNISLIADARIAELQIQPRPRLFRRWLVAFVLIAIILVGVVFGGTYLSKERYLRVVRAQADEVLKENASFLEEVSQRLASGKPEDYKRIYEIRSFLESQRSDLPQLTLIYSGKFADKLALYRVNDYFSGDLEKGTYTPAHFACTRNLDCEYLTKFFSGDKAEILQKYVIRNDEFYIYIPLIGKESRFVLLFERRNSYGKLGS